MIRILIIDDERIIREDLTLLLQNKPGLFVVGSCSTVQEAKILINATQPDLLLLDIQLNDGTGFDLLASQPEFTFQVIFVTAYDQFAINAIKYGALDYLLKPVDEHELNAALDRAVQKIKSGEPFLHKGLDVAQQHYSNDRQEDLQRIMLRSQHTFHVVMVSEILYCESSSSYAIFYLTGNRKVVASRPMKEYEELLPQNYFLRCHNSYLVNIRFVDHFHTEGYLALKDGQQVPVSRRRRDDVVSFLSGGSKLKNH